MSNNTTKLRQQLRSNFLQLCSYKIRQKLCVKEYHKRNTQIFIYVTQLVLPLNIVVLQLGRKISVLIGHYINFYLCFVHCSVCKIMRIVKYFFLSPLNFYHFPLRAVSIRHESLQNFFYQRFCRSSLPCTCLHMQQSVR